MRRAQTGGRGRCDGHDLGRGDHRLGYGAHAWRDPGRLRRDPAGVDAASFDGWRPSSAGAVTAIVAAMVAVAVTLSLSFTGAVAVSVAVASTVSLVATRGHPVATEELAAKLPSRMPVRGSVVADVPYMPEVTCHGEASAAVMRVGLYRDSAVSRHETTTSGRSAMPAFRRSAACCYPADVESGRQPGGKDEQSARTRAAPR